MKPRTVIIGAGLGGCFVAHGLAETHDVTVVELGASDPDIQTRVKDIAAPALITPHVGSGFGGTTGLWHNGLIDIDEHVFAAKFPFPKRELIPHYREAYPFLAGVPMERVQRGIEVLREKYVCAGLPKLGLPGLFYPRRRRNVWDALKLQGRVRTVRGEVRSLETGGDRRIASVSVRTDGGICEQISGDAFVLAAGGLGTPVLLQELETRLPIPALRHAGCHYEDHPMTFVGELTMKAPLYRFWNFQPPGTGGSLRMPLVVRQDGLDVSFHIRPAAAFYIPGRRAQVHSIVSDIRNNRFNPLGYIRLLRHLDDVLDILSFEFGLRVPTKRYSLMMVAEQPPSPDCAVRGISDPITGRSTIEREWHLSREYLALLDKAIDQVVERLGGVATGFHRFPRWQETLHSAAHHSGTARMTASVDEGVCDAHGRVRGLENLYVADGSVIPSSGIANTGLTIAALSLRLAEHLKAAGIAA